MCVCTHRAHCQIKVANSSVQHLNLFMCRITTKKKRRSTKKGPPSQNRSTFWGRLETFVSSGGWSNAQFINRYREVGLHRCQPTMNAQCVAHVQEVTSTPAWQWAKESAEWSGVRFFSLFWSAEQSVEVWEALIALSRQESAAGWKTSGHLDTR